MRLYIILLCLFSSFLISAAYADIDCGNETISVGLTNDIADAWTMEKVKKVCGAPTEIKNWSEESLNKYGESFIKTTVNYSMWTYNRGSNTFIEYLTFKDGILVNIKDGEYGSS